MDKNKFVSSSLSLIIVNLLVMLINFNYNIRLTQLIGPEGMGLLQMAMSVLMICLVVSIGGIPTAVSKLIAGGNYGRERYGAEDILRMAIFLVSTLASLLALVLIFFGKSLAFKLFEHETMYKHLYFLIPAIFLISYTSVYRSYYYGLDMIKAPNISQILESLAQFVFILLILFYFGRLSPSSGAMIAIISLSWGEGVNLVYLLLNKRKVDKKLKKKSQSEGNPMLNLKPGKKTSQIRLFTKIISIALPIGISNSLAMSARFATTLLIPKNLMAIGYSSTAAMEVLGRIMGMAMPLITLPFMITSAVGIIIVPNLAGEMAAKNYHKVKEQILFAIKISFLCSLPIGSLYRIFPDYIAQLLYNDLELGRFIYIMSFNTIFLSLQNISSSILHGLNRQVLVSRNKLIGVFIQIASCLLIANPRIGIEAYFIGFYLSTILVSSLNLFALRSMIKLEIDLGDKILRPLFASSLMIAFIRLFLNLKGDIIHKPIFFIGSLLGASIYLLILHILKVR